MGFDRVSVNQSVQSAGIQRDTSNDLAIFASRPTLDDVSLNTQRVYSNPTEVASRFGVDSDAAIAANRTASAGADSFRVIMLEEIPDSITTGDDQAVSSGVIPDTPVHDITSVTIDGTEVPSDNIHYTTSTPQAPDNGIVIHTGTGEWVISNTTSGDDAGVVIEYTTLSWPDAFSELDYKGIDLAFPAASRFTEKGIGDLDTLIDWADTEDASVSATIAADQYESDLAAMEASHAISSYVSGRNVLMTATKTNGDCTAALMGHISAQNPWYDPDFDARVNWGMEFGTFRPGLVGGPGIPGTFEGGNDQGQGCTNVIMPRPDKGISAPILSESLTPIGAGSIYQWWDIHRTRAFLTSEVTNGLTVLKANSVQIPFNEDGRTLVIDALRKRLNRFVSSGGIYTYQRQLADDASLFNRSAGSKEGGQSGGVGGQGGSGNTEEQSGGGQSGGANVTAGGGNQRTQGKSGPSRGSPASSAGQYPLSELLIDVPYPEQFDTGSRLARRFDPIRLVGQLASNAHYFGVDFELTI